jgi:predicted NBD/HSP70 family sugar kinase
VPLCDLLRAQLHVPVVIEHDANAAALGERWRGTAQDLENFAFVALGTGIGVGIVLNGELYRGAHHAAGELGDLVVGREYLGQDRGGQGNLAQLIGGKTLRRRAKQATGDDMSAAEVVTHADDDEELAAMADEVADYLAMAIIAIAALLDPEAIIVGGGTAEAGEDLLDPVRERVASEVSAPPLIIASAFGSEAQLYGQYPPAEHREGGLETGRMMADTICASVWPPRRDALRSQNGWRRSARLECGCAGCGHHLLSGLPPRVARPRLSGPGP